jgi:hypothetical protein
MFVHSPPFSIFFLLNPILNYHSHSLVSLLPPAAIAWAALLFHIFFITSLLLIALAVIPFG